MKTFSLKSGVNYIDNGYGHIFGIKAGKITNVEVQSSSPGEVLIEVRSSGFDKAKSTFSVLVGNDGYGVSGGLNVLFGYGDTLTVKGLPVESGNTYMVRCYYE